ncbi:hypothetical protein [Pseudomonas sp. C32]|uniref:hypothetical protein n=1 Tax=Pseudomonas sp. C32 TaxID=1529208 RepID=UPI00260FE71F|nr:hypothetical protein [Pseudomonas sp. C32]MDN4546997.1 hypothetical protein [Pseudomonas sp. C32]
MNSLILRNRHAKLLKEKVLEKMESGYPFQSHSNGLNLSWLAKELGTSRQIFYPGRGSSELISVVELLNRHRHELNLLPAKDISTNQAVNRVRTQLMQAKEENEDLKKRVRQLEKINDTIFTNSLLTDLTNEDLPSN